MRVGKSKHGAKRRGTRYGARIGTARRARLYASGAQVREEQHVADGRGVGEQHDEAVDADAHRRPHGGMPYSMRAQVVLVVAHRLLVAARLRRHLRREALALVDGVDQLGERVGQLAPGDDELEALGQLRLARLLARQRRGLERVLGHERRLDERVLDELLEQLGDQLARAPRVLVRHRVLSRTARAAPRASGAKLTSSPAASLVSSIIVARRHGDAEVELGALVRDRASSRAPRRPTVPDEPLGQLHHARRGP